MTDRPTLTDLLQWFDYPRTALAPQDVTAALHAVPRGEPAFTIPCEHPGWSGLDRCDICAGAGVLPVGVLTAPVDEPTLQARLDEAEEKIAYLQAGCMKLNRSELIQRITEVGPGRWKAGIWLEQRLDADRAAHAAAPVDEDALRQEFVMMLRFGLHSSRADEAANEIMRVLREAGLLRPEVER